jgi:hypothetical protein
VAGVKRPLTGHAIAGLASAGLLVCIVLWMWLDFHYGPRGSTDIGSALGVMLLFMSTVLALLYCCIVLLRRRARGLPAFRLADSETPYFEMAALRSPASPAESQDPLDPAYLLRNPPPGAQVTQHGGRRVVVLADGSVIGELLGGRAQRFPSLEDFRSFTGA